MLISYEISDIENTLLTIPYFTALHTGYLAVIDKEPDERESLGEKLPKYH